MVDLLAYGCLHACGGIFCYKLMSIFRQHILPLVVNTRKCLTVVLNVFWFGHTLKWMQWVGIALVFGGIMVEIVTNYNLANRILPNKNIRNRAGANYNKIIPKDEDFKVGYHPRDESGYLPQDEIGDDVEGI